MKPNRPRMPSLCVATAMVAMFVAPTLGDVDLSWSPQPRTVAVGVAFDIGLWATTDDGGLQTISAIDVIVSWDAQRVTLIGVINDGPYEWLQSGFLPDVPLDGLNNTFLDGNAKYTAFSALGNPALATGTGLHVTTLQFLALDQTDLSHIVIEQALGNFSVTRVLGADAPNQNVTGILFSAEVSVIPPTDCDGDGDIDLADASFYGGVMTGPGF